MRRTQLYLDDNLWNALHAVAKSENTTISALVRDAVRKQYLSDREERTRAMTAFIGAGRSGKKIDAVGEVNRLRRDDRLARLHEK